MHTQPFRIGLGHDMHRLGDDGPLRLGGVTIPHDKHAIGHSDADVLLHAVTDALLGALSLPDIGELFPNDDPAHRGRDSAHFLREAVERMHGLGYQIVNLDCVIFAQRPKLSAHKAAIRHRLAELLDIPAADVGIKAKTGEDVDAVGRDEAIVAQCVVLIVKCEHGGGEA